jgi:hypothetical protein
MKAILIDLSCVLPDPYTFTSLVQTAQLNNLIVHESFEKRGFNTSSERMDAN